MGATPSEKPVNWALVITGAFASAFVGTLYGYSYLKGGITDYWKWYAENESVDPVEVQKKVTEYTNNVDTAYYAGFFGQYLAIIPGLVFDAFGATVTCIYGGILCCTGFIMVGYGVKNVTGMMVIIGLCLAGQGSKGLGFGTLLGTIRNSPERLSTLISGLYLCLDACSAVICLFAFDLFKNIKGLEKAEEDEKAQGMQTFLMALGVIIGIVGITAGVIYYVAIPKEDEDEAEQDVEDPQKDRRNSSASYRGRRSSIIDDAALATGKLVSSDDEDAKPKSGAKKPLMQEDADGKPAHPPTFWKGVICCYIVMLLSESQGLAFNNAIGDAFMAARKSEIGTVKYQSLPDAHTDTEKFTDLTRQLLAEEDLTNNADEADAARIVSAIKKEFHNVPRLMTVDNSGAAQTVFTFKGPHTEPRKITIGTKLADDVKLLTGSHCEGCKLTVGACKDPADPCDVFDKYYGKGWVKIDDQFQKVLNKLTPVAGWQVHTAKNAAGQPESTLYLVTQVDSDTFHPNGEPDGDNKGKVENPEHYIQPAIKLTAAGADLQKSAPQLFKDQSLNKIKAGKLMHAHADGSERALRATLDDGSYKEGWKVQKFHYPIFADDFKAVQSAPFHKWVIGLEKKPSNKVGLVFFQIPKETRNTGETRTVDGAEVAATEQGYFSAYDKAKVTTFRSNKDESLIAVESPDAKIYYDAIQLEKKLDGVNDSHAHKMKAEIKKYLTITFTLGNAVGRLGVGMLMELLAGKFYWMPSAIWFVIGCVLYGALFLWFVIGGVPATMSDWETNVAAPFSLWFLTAFIAVLYGGIFTINTAYMKKVVHPDQLGVVLGGSLVVLSCGAFIFGQVVHSGFMEHDFDKTIEPVGTRRSHVFFVFAAGMQLLALVPAAYCWLAQVAQIKANMEEIDDGDDSE